MFPVPRARGDREWRRAGREAAEGRSVSFFEPDHLAAHNERVKLRANSANAVGLGLIAFAVLRPLTSNLDSAGTDMIPWSVAGVGLHGLASRMLGRIKKEVT